MDRRLSATGRTAPAVGSGRRFAKLLALDLDIRKPSLLGSLSRGGLAISCTLVTAGQRLLASLAIARSTFPGVLIALPRRITKIARPSLYTLRHA